MVPVDLLCDRWLVQMMHSLPFVYRSMPRLTKERLEQARCVRVERMRGLVAVRSNVRTHPWRS